jgi:hypothetical protein
MIESRRRQLAALAPLRAEAMLYEMAPTQAEGYAMGEATDRAQSSLAQRGLGDSTLVGPEVAKALAPYLLQREANIHDRLVNLATMTNSIYQQTQAPGYGQALAGFAGDAGGMLVQMAGENEGEARLMRIVEALRMGKAGLAGGKGPTGDGTSSFDFGLPGTRMLPGADAYGIPAGPSADEDIMGLVAGFREGAARHGIGGW